MGCRWEVPSNWCWRGGGRLMLMGSAEQLVLA